MPSSQSRFPHLSDEARLAALNSFAIMDSGPDSAFDDLARLAAMVCAAPVAYIAFVDSRRHWVKAGVGAVVEDSDVERSICAAVVDRARIDHALVAVHRDVRQHPEFGAIASSHREIEIVFHAACPLLTDEGHAIGAICVIDRQPRELTSAQAEGLQIVARQIMARLELRRALLAAQSAEVGQMRVVANAVDRLQLAMEAGNLGDWQWKSSTDTVMLSARALELFGVTAQPDRWIARSMFLPLIEPQHRDRITTALAESMANGRTYEAEYPVEHPDGRVVWLAARGRPSLRSDGTVDGMIGVVVDITERKRMESGLKQTTRRLALVAGLSAIAGRTSDPAEFVSEAVDFARQSIGVQGGGFADVNGRRITAFGRFGLPPVSEDGVADNRASQDVASQRTDDRAGDRTVGEGTRRHAPAAWFDEISLRRATLVMDDTGVPGECRSYLCVPLMRAGALAGVLEFHDHRPRYWTAEEVALAEAAAERLWLLLEKIRAEQAVRDGDLKFRLAADMIPQLAWMARADGTMFWFNQRWHDYTGEAMHAGRGLAGEAVHDGAVHRWLDHVEPAQREMVRERFRQTLASRADRLEETVSLIRFDGVVRGHLARAMPLRDDAGNTVLWFGTFTDVSEQLEVTADRERLLDAERAAREQAEYTSRMKDEFLATLSHELRTPLTAILGWSQVLMRLPSPTQVHADGVAAIDRNARNQAQIIEDLLDMSRIIAGRLRLEPRQQSLEPILRSALQGIRPDASLKGIELILSVEDDLPALWIDEGRLAQILWNLLSNAVKFTPDGGSVTLAAWASRDGGGPARAVVVRVSDSGEGIDQAFLPHLFGRFTQADGSRTRNAGGLGLGLAIVKQLVELHGGRIDVSSEGRGKGAAFDLTLPVEMFAAGDASGMPASPEMAQADARRPADESPAAGALPDGPGKESASHGASDGASSVTSRRSSEPPSVDEAAGHGNDRAQPAGHLEGLSVLVVDDQEDNRMVLQRIIEQHGARVMLAGSAAQAFDLLCRHRPDLIVSDIGMPVEDGYALMRRIRDRQPGEGGLTPAIALTAYARPEDRAKTLEVGYQAHVTKPVDPGKLMTAIAALAPSSARSGD